MYLCRAGRKILSHDWRRSSYGAACALADQALRGALQQMPLSLGKVTLRCAAGDSFWMRRS